MTEETTFSCEALLEQDTTQEQDSLSLSSCKETAPMASNALAPIDINRQPTPPPLKLLTPKKSTVTEVSRPSINRSNTKQNLNFSAIKISTAPNESQPFRRKNQLIYAVVEKLPTHFKAQMLRIVDFYESQLDYYFQEVQKLQVKYRAATKKTKRPPCLYIDRNDLWDIHELRIHNQEKEDLKRRVKQLEEQLQNVQFSNKELEIKKLRELIEENAAKQQQNNRQKSELVKTISAQEGKIQALEKEIGRLNKEFEQEEVRKKIEAENILQLKQDRSYLTDQLAETRQKLERMARYRNDDGISESLSQRYSILNSSSSQRLRRFNYNDV